MLLAKMDNKVENNILISGQSEIVSGIVAKNVNLEFCMQHCSLYQMVK